MSSKKGDRTNSMHGFSRIPPSVSSNTHGFRVKPPYEWSHVDVKETTQRLISINKNHRKRNKTKLCFTTSTRSIPMRGFEAKPSNRPSSAPAVSETPILPTPPSGNKHNFNTRKIRSAVPRVNVPAKKEEPRSESPSFELRRTPTNVEMKVQLDEADTTQQLKVIETEKFELEEEIERLKQQIMQLQEQIEIDTKVNKEKMSEMQLEFNRNLSQTLEEKKKDLKRVKETHYSEVSSLKQKMNDALKVQRNESSLMIAKLKGEIDSSRENFRNFKDKVRLEHSEALQDLQNELTLKHQREKIKQLRDLEEKLTREKAEALDHLKDKMQADISLLKQQHSHDMDEILHTFDGINVEEVEMNRNTIREQEIQLMTLRSNRKKMNEEMRVMMNELNSHKTALRELQDSFFDKVHQVDQKYTHQLSSLLVDNKDLRKRYLRKCDELFTLKASYNRLQEAKGYIAREMLHAIMQGKQPHVITSSAVKASWSTDGLAADKAEFGRSEAPSERATSACSEEDPAALMLSTCSYIHDNSGSLHPKPLSDQLFRRDEFMPASIFSQTMQNEENTSPEDPLKLTRVVPTITADTRPPVVPSADSKPRRPISSVCVVRPHSRQSFSDEPPKSGLSSADPGSKTAVVNSPNNKKNNTKYLDVANSEFNLPALPVSPELSRRKSEDEISACDTDLVFSEIHPT